MSDIHSNVIALEACLAYIEQNPVDAIVILGDFVSDCPEPRRTLTMLYEWIERMPVYCIRGNREEYFLSYRSGSEANWTSSSYKGSLLYTYERLEGQDFAWFESLPLTQVLLFPGTAPIRLVHGSPMSAKELLDEGMDNTKGYLKALDTDYLLAGHTHRQMQYTYEGKTIINPGSVGVAIGVTCMAHMAYLSWEHEKWQPTFLSIPFSFEAVQAWFLKSSLLNMAYIWPICILKSMQTGKNMGPLCAKRAYDLALSEQKLLEDGSPPESYWQKAARELGVL
ncbi:MAG: hypothetical protein PWP24_1256 [Clostridiales bacterium]|nr:hypothetical protein [Clostridiales bacterium]